MIDHQIRLATGSGGGGRVEKGVRARYLQALEHGDVAQGRAGELRYLGAGAALKRMPVHHAHVAPLQAHVGAAEAQQQQRQEQNGADNQQDLEALERRYGHRRGRHRGQSGRKSN